MTFRRSLEMTISRDDFFRLLPAVIATFDTDGEAVRWADVGGAGTIHVVSLPARRLGSIALPRHRVEIALEASQAGGERFMERFHRAFLRAGG